MEPIRSYCSASVGLPLLAVGRLLHCTFRGLLSVYSRYGLHARQVAYATLYTRGSDDFVSSVAALIATGWSEPAPGRDFHPLRISAFHGAPQACAIAWLYQPCGAFELLCLDMRTIKYADRRRNSRTSGPTK
jgi:hypothetical protein